MCYVDSIMFSDDRQEYHHCILHDWTIAIRSRILLICYELCCSHIYLDVVSECSWGEPSSNSNGSSNSSVFEDSTLSVWSGWHYEHICWVLDGCNSSSSEHKFLPHLTHVQYKHTCNRQKTLVRKAGIFQKDMPRMSEKGMILFEVNISRKLI